MDYHVWGATLKHYQRHTPKLADIMMSWKTVLIFDTECFPSQVRWYSNCVILHQILIVYCCNWWALTLWRLCLNTEWGIDICHSWLKHLNCWLKAVKHLIHYSWILNVHCILHGHFKKWTLKFKRLYLRNHISNFNKICRIWCMKTRIQSVKVWSKSVLSWQKYSIFSRGLFFIGAPCRCKAQLVWKIKLNSRHKGQFLHHSPYSCGNFRKVVRRYETIQ